MNVKQRIRRLERIMHDRLAAAAAEAALSIKQGPPLTEKEARRLDPHALLALIEVELHPSDLRKSVDFDRYRRNYRRVPLLKLYRYYLALKQRQSKIQVRRRKGTFPKGSIEYYQLLRNIYGEMTEAAARAERDARFADREALYQQAAHIVETRHEANPEINDEIRPPAPRPSQFAWAVA